jgi:hypothetical protein
VCSGRSALRRPEVLAGVIARGFVVDDNRLSNLFERDCAERGSGLRWQVSSVYNETGRTKEPRSWRGKSADGCTTRTLKLTGIRAWRSFLAALFRFAQGSGGSKHRGLAETYGPAA